MPEGRRIGLDNPHLSGRVRSHDRSAYFVRRPVQPQMRRSIDGFSLPTVTSKVASVSKKTQSPKPKFTQGLSDPHSSHKPKPALPRQARSAVLARHAVQPKIKKRKTFRPKHSPASILLISMAFVLFTSGTVISYLGWKTNRKAATQVEALSNTEETEGNGDLPSEDDIPQDLLTAYHVAPDLPRYIRIPRLEVNARVKRLGVKPTGELMAPSNVFDAGWYDGSSKPRDGGTTLIDGHVHGPSKPGVFYRLGSLKPGDTMEIELGDGQVFTYKVVTTEYVDQNKVDMAKALVSIEPGKGALNLITCSGRYDVRTNKYEQRLIVYAVQQ